MAIAYDNSTKASQSSGTSNTFAHTCTGSDLVLIVGTIGRVSADTITGVTYNSVAMTKITAFSGGGEGRWITLWYLANPSTGANNVVATWSASQDFIHCGAVSYTGCKQTGIPDSFATGADAGNEASHTFTTTVVASNAWLMLWTKYGLTPAAGAGTTARQTDGSGLGIFDSNGTVGTGSQSLIATQTSNNTEGIIISLAPTAVAATGNFFMVF